MPAFNKIETQLGLSGAFCALVVGLAINVFGAEPTAKPSTTKQTAFAHVSVMPVAASNDQATPLIRPLQKTWIF